MISKQYYSLQNHQLFHIKSAYVKCWKHRYESTVLEKNYLPPFSLPFQKMKKKKKKEQNNTSLLNLPYFIQLFPLNSSEKHLVLNVKIVTMYLFGCLYIFYSTLPTFSRYINKKNPYINGLFADTGYIFHCSLPLRKLIQSKPIK